jgi:hypothetical protein
VKEPVWIDECDTLALLALHTALPLSPGHPFYQRLHELLETEKFDEYVERRVCEVLCG